MERESGFPWKVSRKRASSAAVAPGKKEVVVAAARRRSEWEGAEAKMRERKRGENEWDAQ